MTRPKADVMAPRMRKSICHRFTPGALICPMPYPIRPPRRAPRQFPKYHAD